MRYATNTLSHSLSLSLFYLCLLKRGFTGKEVTYSSVICMARARVQWAVCVYNF